MQQTIASGDLNAGNIAEQSAKADRDQQQRFKLFRDGQVEQQQADNDHSGLTGSYLRQA
jgi:hypothetical protein